METFNNPASQLVNAEVNSVVVIAVLASYYKTATSECHAGMKCDLKVTKH